VGDDEGSATALRKKPAARGRNGFYTLATSTWRLNNRRRRSTSRSSRNGEGAGAARSWRSCSSWASSA